MKPDTLKDKIVPVTTILAVLVVIWYIAAILMNASFQRDMDARGKVTPTTMEFIEKTLSQPKPLLPAPHQVAQNFFENTFLRKLTSNRSLVYHSGVTLSSTALGFALGTLLGILIAVGIVHIKALDRSLMPWIITSQTIPILAIAPMVIVVLGAINITGLIPKALISTYLSFFPVTVGMVKGLRSPEVMLLDLMRTYNASAAQTFWKLRVPASVPYLFTSMKVAIAASLVGAIVGELPTGAVAGIGSKLLAGAYYSQTIDIWAALIAGSLLAALADRHRQHRRQDRRQGHGREIRMRHASWQGVARPPPHHCRLRIAAAVCRTAARPPSEGTWHHPRPHRRAALISFLPQSPTSRGTGSVHRRPWRRMDAAVRPAGNEGLATKSFFLPDRRLLAARLALRHRARRRMKPASSSERHRSAAPHPGDLRRLDPDHLGIAHPRRRHSLRPAAAAERHRRPHRRIAADPG
jgi:NitT/TauT family transport system permease protein